MVLSIPSGPGQAPTGTPAGQVENDFSRIAQEIHRILESGALAKATQTFVLVDYLANLHY